jgi:cytoskeleton protein RodZ
MTEPITDPTSAGAMLRAAREKQGLHIAALAAAIKVAPRKLDALENNRWGELPDATFTRALAQTVCRALKIDPLPVLALLPAQEVAVLEPGGGSGLGEPFYDSTERGASAIGSAAIRPMVLGALALMLAAVGLYFLPPDWLTSSTQQIVKPASTAPSAPEAQALPAMAATNVEPASASAAAPSAPARTATAGDAASAPAAAVAPAAVQPAATPHVVPAPTLVPVQLRMSAASWVEARDARGQLLLSRIVQPGEQLGIDGALPMRLTIGNAAGTQLTFRGQGVDLAPRTRDNVARVELP